MAVIDDRRRRRGDFSPAALDGLLLAMTADPGYVFQDSAGTTAAVSHGDPVGLTPHRFGGSLDLSQSTDAERPTLDIAPGNGVRSIESDGTQSIGGTMSGLTSDMYICYSMQSTDDGAIVFKGDGVGHWGGIFDQGSTSTAVTGGMGTPALKVDGVAVVSPTRGDLYDLLADGVWHVVEFVGADMSAIEWQQFSLFNYSGFRYDGNLGSFIIAATPDIERQEMVRNWTASKVGLSL